MGTTDFSALKRVELADLHHPTRIAAKIHQLLGAIDGPIPILEITKALDVSKVKLDVFDGFEGMLLTDDRRSKGVIVANTGNGRKRARFTVAHELGHFLMERHRPSDGNGFRCMPSDMREWGEKKRHQRQEAEANRFAIELLAPRGRLETAVAHNPDLEHVEILSGELDISKEAAARRYVELHDARIAMIFFQGGSLRCFDKSDDFPFLAINQDAHLPPSVAAGLSAGTLTDVTEADPKDWLDGLIRGELWVQTLHQRDGYGITMLTLAPDDLDDGGPKDTFDSYTR